MAASPGKSLSGSSAKMNAAETAARMRKESRSISRNWAASVGQWIAMWQDGVVDREHLGGERRGPWMCWFKRGLMRRKNIT